MDKRAEIVEWVGNLAKSLVEKPEDLSIKSTTDERGLLIEIFAATSQLGQLIGKQGKTAEAIRTLASVYGVRKDARISIKINDALR